MATVNTCKLSDWELDEMRMLRGRGWSMGRLASWYGVSEKTVRRILQRMGTLSNDSRPASIVMD